MIDPRIAYQVAKEFAYNKQAQMAGGGVLTAGVVIFSQSLNGVWRGLHSFANSGIRRCHDFAVHFRSYSIDFG